MPDTQSPAEPTPEGEAIKIRVTAANEMFAAGGLRPTLRQMRLAVAAIREAEERGAARERERCLADIEGERLTGETGDEGDAAYNMALEHAAMVVRARH